MPYIPVTSCKCAPLCKAHILRYGVTVVRYRVREFALSCKVAFYATGWAEGQHGNQAIPHHGVAG
jgi:hypothetical protein